MYHNLNIQIAQLDRFLEHGMPLKIIKTVKYKLKRRLEKYKQCAETDERQHAFVCDTNVNFEQYNKREDMSLSVPSSSSVCSEVSSLSATAKGNTAAEIQLKQSNLQKMTRVCDRFIQQNDSFTNEHLIRRGESDAESQSTCEKTDEIYEDALSICTKITKHYAQRFNQTVEKLQSKKIYTLLTRTTQPTHIIAVGILSFLLVTVWSDLVNAKNNNRSQSISNKDVTTIINDNNTLAVLAYLGAFATHFGAQIWMTFVSGLSLYLSLPRHTFGQCQQILFPKYFALNSILSIGMLILFIKYFLFSWNLTGCVQLMALAITAIIEVTVYLYLSPPMLRLMHEKYKMESAIGSGHEIGSVIQGDLIHCPHYQRIHKAFRRIHMIVAMGNMAVLLAAITHLYFLATKIQISG